MKPPSPPSTALPLKVAFLCWGNACRSIMAEALARHFHGACLDPCSAGLHPLGHIPRETLQVLAEAGVSPEGLRSKGLSEIELARCRLLVNLTDYSVEKLLPPLPDILILPRPIPDPYGGGLEAYRQARDAIRTLLRQEIAGWIGSDAPGRSCEEVP